MVSQRSGNPVVMLMIHAPIAAMTSTATCGREACRTGGWTPCRMSPLAPSPLAACSARGDLATSTGASAGQASLPAQVRKRTGRSRPVKVFSDAAMSCGALEGTHARARVSWLTSMYPVRKPASE
jgi:hypothetical protein